ncbi:MAG TPA: phosphoenolpyruvate--protein phosphotransferase [Spirochaetia bacterium]|nr:phosphoenolpyruvate--protein phosphotransferase [Spirochaetia bacterium]
MIKDAIEEVAGRISFFEDEKARSGLLKELINLIVMRTGVDMGAVFVHDESNGELVLRAGFERGELWEADRFADSRAPLRFGLEGNEVGRAFTEGRIIWMTYEESGPDHPYRSKILIPILRGPIHTGVLILARADNKGFGREDEAGLMAAASRFGDLLTDASALLVSRESDLSQTPRRSIRGIKASDGQAYGLALPFWTDIETLASQATAARDASSELALFETALAASVKQVSNLQDSASSSDIEMAAMIFSAHELMLKDGSFTDKMRRRIQDGQSAVQSVQSVVAEYADLFSAMTEVRLAEKAQDVRDLGYRLINNIVGGATEGFSYKGRIAIARHMYPSDLYRLAVEGVEGLVLRGSGVTAHISILARSLGLPVMITDDRGILNIPEGTPLLLDARNEWLHVNPDPVQLDRYQASRGGTADDLHAYHLKGRTADGTEVQVLANVNILRDALEATAQGAEGIGLYRSEFPFILKNDYLSEEQQFRIYRSIVASQSGKPVVLRTADIGGDKLLQGRGEAEENPFLGVRGIRFSLANREMFREQLRAMLRAGEGADLGIMLPMVSGVEEVLEAKEEIRLAAATLAKRRVGHNASPRIGAMVELPSAAMAVGDLASETDFLSIGTNDLTMYLLAVDRTNEKLHHLYQSHHPTVLRVFSAIARFSGKKREDLSVCGDVASDPVLLPFFVGIGIRKLSVSPAKVEFVKRRLASFTLAEMREISRELLAIRRLAEMEQYLKTFDSRHGGKIGQSGGLSPLKAVPGHALNAQN